jgi:MDMPI C-terminal domain
VLRRFLAGDWSDEPAPERPGDVVQVRSGGTTWRVVMEPQAIVANVHLDRWPGLPAAATVSGDPVSMYLWLWGRGPRDSLTVDGDPASLDHLRARLVPATQ